MLVGHCADDRPPPTLVCSDQLACLHCLNRLVSGRCQHPGTPNKAQEAERLVSADLHQVDAGLLVALQRAFVQRRQRAGAR